MQNRSLRWGNKLQTNEAGLIKGRAAEHRLTHCEAMTNMLEARRVEVDEMHMKNFANIIRVKVQTMRWRVRIAEAVDCKGEKWMCQQMIKESKLREIRRAYFTPLACLAAALDSCWMREGIQRVTERRSWKGIRSPRPRVVKSQEAQIMGLNAVVGRDGTKHGERTRLMLRFADQVRRTEVFERRLIGR
jgi:hypothetical protein